jgi:outer membrane protein assembly factor BamB
MKKLIVATLTLLVAMSSLAQTTNDWKKNFDSKIKWYKITDAGILVVCTKEALYGINPSDGKEIWKDEDVENIKEEEVKVVENTPYVAVFKQGFVKNSLRYIDVVTGKVVANSKDYINAIMRENYIPKTNSVLFQGLNAKGKMALVKFNLTDGTKMWEQTDVADKYTDEIVSDAFETSSGLFVATTKAIFKLNSKTGQVLNTIEIKSGATYKDEKEPRMDAMNRRSADFFLHDNPDMIYYWNTSIFTALNIADGKEVWKRVELRGPVSKILFDTRGMLLTTSGKGGKGELLCLDPKTGNQVWASDVIIKGNVAAYKMSGNKLMLATSDVDRNYITVINLDQGKTLTKKPLGIDGDIRDMQLVPQGLYYRAANQINIVDMETGKNLWKKGGLEVENSIGDNKNDKEGFVFADKKIQKVNFETGEVKVWVEDIKFEGKETPSSLQVRDNGVLLTSEQNATLFDFDGKQTWHYYVPAPKRTLTGNLLSGLGGLASAAVAVGGAVNSASMSYNKGYYGTTAYDSSIKSSNDIASGFANAAGSSFAAIGKRFKATKEANDCMSMLAKIGATNEAKDAGIKLLDKNTGKEIRSVLLGAKKDLDYKLDGLGKMVFFKADDNELKGFGF